MVQTEGEWATQQVIAEGPDHPSNRQTLLFDCAVLRLSLRQFPTNVQHGAVDPLHLLSQNGPQPSVRRVSLQNKREREVRGEQQRLPTEGFFYPRKRPLARLRLYTSLG